MSQLTAQNGEIKIRSHRIALDPTYTQLAYFEQAAGTARFVWNWGLEEWNRQHAAGEKPSGNKLRAEFNVIKYEQFPWLQNIHRDAHSRPFANLQMAFVRFFKKTGKYPKFKSKHKSRASFYAANDQFRVDGFRVKLPRIGWIRMTEELRFPGKIMGAVVSRTADRWFIAIQVETQVAPVTVPPETVGVDLGITAAATLSTGESFEAPKPLKKNLKKLRRLSRRQSRKQQGSKNCKKANARLARLHARIANIRNDFLHKLTAKLLRENQTVVIEDLNVKGMMANRKMARAILDISFGEFRRQLEYKSRLYGNEIIVADRFFPSSKACSSCGEIKEALELLDRVYHCEGCGLSINRDLNAALNLSTLGLRETYACGPESADGGTCSDVKLRRVEAGTKP